jgi:hypothetical protein
MTENYLQKLATENEIPDHLIPFVLDRPRLLPGESEEEFFQLMDLMLEDILPETNIEWLIAAELAALWWDIRRYGRWKNAVLAINRHNAVEVAFLKTDPARIVAGQSATMRALSKQNAEKWRSDPQQRKALGAQLTRNGYDDDAINAGALMEGLMTVSTIDRFLSSARAQMNAMLREVFVRREFVDRARKSFKKTIEAEANKRTIEAEANKEPPIEADANEEPQITAE